MPLILSQLQFNYNDHLIPDLFKNSFFFPDVILIFFSKLNIQKRIIII